MGDDLLGDAPPAGNDASKRFDRKTDAEKAARKTARRERTEQISHRRDGTIGERRRYGNDPHPPPGWPTGRR